MKLILSALLSIAIDSLALAADSAKEIAALSSPEITNCRAAVEAIQTLDDPPACRC